MKFFSQYCALFYIIVTELLATPMQRERRALQEWMWPSVHHVVSVLYTLSQR